MREGRGVSICTRLDLVLLSCRVLLSYYYKVSAQVKNPRILESRKIFFEKKKKNPVGGTSSECYPNSVGNDRCQWETASRENKLKKKIKKLYEIIPIIRIRKRGGGGVGAAVFCCWPQVCRRREISNWVFTYVPEEDGRRSADYYYTKITTAASIVIIGSGCILYKYIYI